MVELDRFVSLKEACRIAGGVAPSTLWRWTKAKRFPAVRKFGPNRSGFLQSEVAAWIAARADSNGTQAKNVEN